MSCFITTGCVSECLCVGWCVRACVRVCVEVGGVRYVSVYAVCGGVRAVSVLSVFCIIHSLISLYHVQVVS